MSGHGYRYTGNGERFRGVPARDLTQAQYDALTPLDQRTVLESGVYAPITAAEAKKAEKDAEDAAKKAEADAKADAEKDDDTERGGE